MRFLADAAPKESLPYTKAAWWESLGATARIRLTERGCKGLTESPLK
jgi:hypothetical protein